MSWTEESILAAFPRHNMTYYIQFVQEPKEVHKKGKYGPWVELNISLQLFSIDEDGGYHYMGSVAGEHKPCVLESLSCFGPDIVTRLIEVKGFNHGKHVDLELINSWERISASATLTRDAPSTAAASDSAVVSQAVQGSSGAPSSSGPPKPAAALEPSLGHESLGSERGQPGAGGAPEPAARLHAEGTDEPARPQTGPRRQQDTQPPAAPCQHLGTIYHLTQEAIDEAVAQGGKALEPGFYCKDCGERVG